MSTEEGTVTKVAVDKAWVLVRRSAACEGCRTSGVCNSLGGSGNMEAEARNVVGAKAGDRVLVKLSSKSIRKISFIFYMIPVIFLAAGAIIGLELGKKNFPASDPEMISLLIALLACGVGFFIVWVYARAVGNKSEFMPEIIRILNPPVKEPQIASSNVE